MIRFLILLVGLCFSVSLSAQKKESIFDVYKKDAELTFGFNNRRTHINSQFGVIYGFKIGLNFDRRLKNTFGINSTIWSLGKPENDVSDYKMAQLHFVSVAEEYIFFKRNRLNFSTYVSLGYGFNNTKSFSPANVLLTTDKLRIIPLEMAVQSSYLLFKWLDIRMGVGWRFFLIGNQDGLPGYFIKVGAGIKYKQLNLVLSKNG